MVDQHAHATQRLRNQVEARVGPLHEFDAPKTAEAAAKLARDDADLFDALWDAGLIGPQALGAKGGN